MTKLERIIYTAEPFAFIIRKSRTLVLPGFHQFHLYEVMNEFSKQLKKIGIIERAAAISFHLIMALPAAVLFLFSIVPYLPESETLEGKILGLFKDITPNSTTYLFIRNLLNELLKKHIGIFSFGFVVLIFYASNAMIGVIRTFDRSIEQKKRFFLHRRLRAIRLTGILILLVIASAIALIGQDSLADLLKSIFHMKRRARIQWWNGVRWFILVGFLFYGIAIIYKFAPSVKKRWPLVSAGSVFATISTLLTTIIFSYWVNNFGSFNKVYGSISTLLIIMLLIHINAMVLLLGFELNVAIMQLKEERDEEKLKEMNGTQDENKVSTFIPAV